MARAATALAAGSTAPGDEARPRHRWDLGEGSAGGTLRSGRQGSTARAATALAAGSTAPGEGGSEAGQPRGNSRYGALPRAASSQATSASAVTGVPVAGSKAPWARRGHAVAGRAQSVGATATQVASRLTSKAWSSPS